MDMVTTTAFITSDSNSPHIFSSPALA